MVQKKREDMAEPIEHSSQPRILRALQSIATRLGLQRSSVSYGESRDANKEFASARRQSTRIPQGQAATTLPTQQGGSRLSVFLDQTRGIPENDQDPLDVHTNERMQELFSTMGIEEICRELVHEVTKRPNGVAYRLLGFAYFDLGRFDDAILALKASLRYTAGDPTPIYEYLGYCYALKNDWKNAKKWSILSLRFDFEYVIEEFGQDFVYVVALGQQQEGNPVFGQVNRNQFIDGYRSLQSMLADDLPSGRVASWQIRVAASDLRRSPHATPLTGNASSVPAPPTWYSERQLESKVVRVATRNTVFGMMAYSMLWAGHFSKGPEQLFSAARPMTSGKGLDVSGALSRGDQRLLDGINDLLDSVPVPSLDATVGEKDFEKYRRSVQRLDALAHGASQVFMKVMENPVFLRFAWSEELIIADAASTGWHFISKHSVFDENDILMGTDFYFERST